MIQFEFRLRGHPRIAKEMVTQFPGKTVKQIRDKRKEVAYKKLLQSHFDYMDVSPGSPHETPQESTSASQAVTEPVNMLPSANINADVFPPPEPDGLNIPTALPTIGAVEPVDRTDQDVTGI
jgi:hypothetical protein